MMAAGNWWRNSRYLPLLAIAQLLLVAKGFAYARILGLADFGLLSQYLLIGNAAAMLCGIGMQWVAQKRWPQQSATRNDARIDVSMTLALALGAITSFAGFLSVAFMYAWGAISATAYFVLPAFSLAQYFFIIGIAGVQSELEFVRVAQLWLWRAVLTGILGLGIALVSGNVASVLICEAIATIVIGVTVFGQDRLRRVLELARNRSVVIAAARVELPEAIRLLVLSLVSYFLFNFDRWVGLATLSVAAYGTYAAGALVLVAFDALRAMLNVAIQPLMARRLATESLSSVIRFAHVCTALTIGLGLIATLPANAALHWVIVRALPGFEGSLAVISILVPVGFLRLADFYGTLAILRNRELVLTGAAVVVAVVALAVVILASKRGFEFTPRRLGELAMGLTLASLALRAGIACASLDASCGSRFRA